MASILSSVLPVLTGWFPFGPNDFIRDGFKRSNLKDFMQADHITVQSKALPRLHRQGRSGKTQLILTVSHILWLTFGDSHSILATEVPSQVSFLWYMLSNVPSAP